MKITKGTTIDVFSPSYVTIYNSPESAKRAEDFLREKWV